MLDLLKKNFRSVHHVKPPASRDESVELYLLAKDFKGRGADERIRPAAAVPRLPVRAADGRTPSFRHPWAGRRNGSNASAVIDPTIRKAVEKEAEARSPRR